MKIVYVMRQLYDSNPFLFWLVLPTVVISWYAYEEAKEKKQDVNLLLIILSAACPILGLLCYLARQNSDKDAANIYLGCAAASFVVWFLMLIFL